MLANAEYGIADLGKTPAAIEEGRRTALSLADRAIALDPELAEGYTARGFFRADHWDWAGAQADLNRALALNPGGSMEHVLRAYLLTCADKKAEAIEAYRKVLEIEPLLPGPWTILGGLLAESRRLPEARQALARALEIAPEYSDARSGLGMASLYENDPKAALAEFEKVTAGPFRLLGVAIAENALGRPKESQRALDALVSGYAVNSAYQIAEVYAQRGERDKAFEWLDRAYDQRDAGLAVIQADEFFFASLRNDPRYAALLKKLNLPLSN